MRIERAVLVPLLALGLAACAGRTRTVGGDAAAAEPAAPAEPEAEPTAEPAPRTPTTLAVTHLALELPAARGRTGRSETAARLVVTDETGAARGAPLGRFDGACEDVTEGERAGTGAPLLAFRCEAHEGRGVLVHLLSRPPELVILRDWLDDGERAFDEIGRIALTPGATVRTDYD